MHFANWLRRWVCGVALSLSAAGLAAARDWYVDNRFGDDGYDGTIAQTTGPGTGPVFSIRRALDKAQAGDIVHIANYGIPYYESLQLVGPRFSGSGVSPFVIDGNGAVLSGARMVPPEAWKYVGDNVWRFTPRRKAFYQLLQIDKPVPEQRDPSPAAVLEAGQWQGRDGSIFFRSPGPGQNPLNLPLAFARDEVGITLLDVEDVIIRNLTIRHFRLDGVNAHDRARHVILENVRLLENGRTGLAVGGTSLVGLKGSQLDGNRLTQVLNAEKAQTEIISSQLGETGGVPYQIKGGHLLIEGEEASR
jgi:hypothetical protein